MENCSVCMQPMTIYTISVMNCTHLAHTNCKNKGSCVTCKLFVSQDEQQYYVDFEDEDEDEVEDIFFSVPQKSKYQAHEHYQAEWKNPGINNNLFKRPDDYFVSKKQSQPLTQVPIIIEPVTAPKIKKIAKSKLPIKKEPRVPSSEFAFKYHRAMIQPPDMSNVDLVQAFNEKKKLETSALIALREKKDAPMNDDRMIKYLEAHRKYKNLLKTDGFF